MVQSSYPAEVLHIKGSSDDGHWRNRFDALPHSDAFTHLSKCYQHFSRRRVAPSSSLILAIHHLTRMFEHWFMQTAMWSSNHLVGRFSRL